MLYNGASDNPFDAAWANGPGASDVPIPFDTFAFSGREDRLGGLSGMRVRGSLR